VFRLRSAAFALLLAACTAATEDAASTSDEVKLGTGGADPIDHLKVIAGPEMNGRGTPSPGLDKAKAYVVAECQKARLAVFEQPFTLPDGAQTSNIVATLPGTGPHASETVIISAHLDHLGAGFPGADDNGSGSAAMLAIAYALPRTLDRSVTFLWTTGEEKGLRGSAYFVDHPPEALPLTRIIQDINLDAIGALQDTRYSLLSDGTARSNATVDLFRAASSEMDRPFARMNQDLEAYRQRTDAYSFIRRGVPAIWVSEGLTNPNGGGSLMPRYHKATDTVENMLAENGGTKLRRMSELLTRTIVKLAS